MKDFPFPAFLRVDAGDDDNPGSIEWADEVPPDATCIVCAPFSIPLLAPDNHVGNCVDCGMAIQFRPVPATVPRVCYRCAPAWIEAKPQ